MTDELILRPEEPGDRDAIAGTVRAAFGREAEAELVAALRSSGGLAHSLVAVAGDAVVGHVALSPVAVAGEADGERWLGLGPLAVLPARQNHGIGRRLVQGALAEAVAAGAAAVFVLGKSSYYRSLGFDAAVEHGWRCVYEVPEPAFRVRRLGPESELPPPGTVRYHAAFDAL